MDVVGPGIRKTGAECLSSMESSLVLPDYESLHVFGDLFVPIVRSLNGLEPFEPSANHPESNLWSGDHEIDLDTIDIDVSGKVLQSCTIEFARNLKDVDFSCNLTLQKLKAVEKGFINAFTDIFQNEHSIPSLTTDNSELETLNGVYYSLLELFETRNEIYKQLQIENLVDPDISTDKIRGRCWPKGRTVYVESQLNLAAWINVQEHLKVIMHTGENRRGRIGTIYNTLSGIAKQLDGIFEFQRDEVFGYMSTDPKFVGTGLRFYANLLLHHLGTDFHYLSQICDTKGLYIKPCEDTSTYQVMNRQSLEITEFDSFIEFASAVSYIVQLEIEQDKAKSSKLTNIWRNLFKRLRNKNKVKI